MSIILDFVNQSTQTIVPFCKKNPLASFAISGIVSLFLGYLAENCSRMFILKDKQKWMQLKESSEKQFQEAQSSSTIVSIFGDKTTNKKFSEKWMSLALKIRS